MFDAIASVGWLASGDDLDELLSQVLCNRDVVIWDGKRLAALIVASPLPDGQPTVLLRHELEIAALIVADRWSTTADSPGGG